MLTVYSVYVKGCRIRVCHVKRALNYTTGSCLSTMIKVRKQKVTVQECFGHSLLAGRWNALTVVQSNDPDVQHKLSLCN